MRFKHEGTRITLRGITANNNYCPTISSAELHQLVEQGAIAQLVALDVSTETVVQTEMPKEVKQLLQENEQLFQESTELPPARSFDHAIPLIPGAVPVQKKPYRYAPSQKD